MIRQYRVRVDRATRIGKMRYRPGELVECDEATAQKHGLESVGPTEEPPAEPETTWPAEPEDEDEV